MTDALQLEIDGPVARIAFNRPDKRNAISQAMWEAFPRLIETAISDRAVRLITIQSVTPAMFSAGADIGEFAERARDPVWQTGNRQALRNAQIAISRAPVPTLAIVDGDCVGAGCGVALACDMRIASSRARFGITPAKLGLVYPLHDIKLLVDLVGAGQARRILYTGELLSADEALVIGLIEMGTTVEALSRETDLLIARIVENAPSSTMGLKGLVRRVLDGDRDDDAASAAIFDAAFAGADFAEGLAAFAARRKPVFADR
ncbi:enoyl-CoA hydratase-related protein [Sphingosinicella sp.]|jgi:enoyl-CoA hydratase/carnithine racemase|uniref:enoyl-CoA hydratase-related protein n=1 Tax=Sphingosinicella sp. TaxID=1917971 RepID=UPI00180B5182|nr:enoyl-CoA hydratase-related protein [Sphingosinicella sp.]MBA4757172.1 enoyl-CoA hydratase/isomerase family protein [Sphingosinicella sp.]